MTRTRLVATFALVTVLFGTAFPAIKTGLRFLPPLHLAAARYALSALLLLTYAVATTDHWYPRTRRDVAATLAGGVLFVGGTGFTFVGQQFIASGVAAIIVSLSPVLTVLLGWVLLPAERPSRRSILGVIVGFAGVAVVVRPAPSMLFDPAVVGRLLVVLATAIVTLGTVLVRRIQAPFPVPALTGWAMVLGASLQAGIGVAVGESLPSGGLPLLAVATVVYLGVFAGALAFGLYFALLERVGPLEANLVTYLNPAVAVVTGWALLGEAVDPLALLGFAVIALGFVLVKERELLAELSRFRGAAR